MTNTEFAGLATTDEIGSVMDMTNTKNETTSTGEAGAHDGGYDGGAGGDGGEGDDGGDDGG